MTQLETLLMCAIILFVVIGWAISCCLLVRQREKNASLEMDVAGLEHYNHMLKSKLAKKKELLEIQDRLLEENNIKH